MLLLRNDDDGDVFFFLSALAQFGGMESVMTAIGDEFVYFRSRRTLVVLLVCGCCFLIGLPTVTYVSTAARMASDTLQWADLQNNGCIRKISCLLL